MAKSAVAGSASIIHKKTKKQEIYQKFHKPIISAYSI